MRKHIPIYLAVAILIFGYMGLLYIKFPTKTFVINKIEVTSATQEGIEIVSDSCRYTDKPFVTTRLLKNTGTGTLIELPEKGTQSTIPLNTCAKRNRTVSLPYTVPIGKYTLTFNISVRVNRFHTVEVTYTTKEFEIK